MDLQRFRERLPSGLRDTVDLNAAWLRYLAVGGLDEEDAFEQWLAEQRMFDARQTLAEAPVEVSIVLPSRFAPRPEAHAPADAARTRPDPARTLAEHEAPTVLGAGKAAPNPASAPAVPDFHYVLLGLAGKGGMGTVHAAKDTELLRRVALKQLSPEADAHASARSRFLREVQITAQLDHPNIVPVYALEVAPGGTPAYTMKFVEGKTFHALLNEAREFFESGKRPDETRTLAARIEHFLKVCDAVGYAHDKGVIHRDLKPANLMLGRHNEVYVMDWGLCRALRQPEEAPADRSVVMSSPDISGGASDTQIGDVVGTPKYMSPEQAQGHNRELDARSDQYALGLILFELVTLSAPFEGSTAYEVLVNAAQGKRRPIVHAYLGKGRIPRDLVAIIERATAYAPDARYASVAGLAADLRRYLRGDAVLARSDNLWQRTQRAIGRNRQRVLTGILALVALAAIAIGGLLWQNQRQFRAERLREQRLLELRDAVADVGSHVQTRMVQLEGAMENLADSVAQISEFGVPVENRYFLLRDFKDPAKAPSDLIPAEGLAGRVSLGWPVWTLPAGMNEASALPTIRKLAALQRFRRDMYHRVAATVKNKDNDLYTSRGSDTSDDLRGNPLVAITFGFNDGLASRYPGWDHLPDNYDPREHPWYKIAAGKYGPQWGNPYRSSITGLNELPLSVPLYDEGQKFVGVAAALLVPDLMVKNLLDIPGIPGLRGVFLLDGRGRILASMGHALPASEQAPDEASLEMFPQPELLRRLKARDTGILEARFGGQPAVLATDEINPLGWNVVAVVDPSQWHAVTGTASGRSP